MLEDAERAILNALKLNTDGKVAQELTVARFALQSHMAIGAENSRADALTYLDIVFDGPPSHESGRFIEVENSSGQSINAGEWIDRGDGTWALRIGSSQPTVAPIDMLLFCPKCGVQHIDAPEVEPGRLISGGPFAGRAIAPRVTWNNPPHRSHLCHACRTIWRPADVPTNGIASIQTRGTADTWQVADGTNS